MIHVDGLIAISHNADAHLGHQRRTENVGVVDPRALIARRAAALKTAVMRSAVNAAVGPIQPRIEDSGSLVAVAHEEPVVGSGHVIDFHVELVDSLALRGGLLKIGRQTGTSGCRYKAKDLGGYGADTSGRYPIVWKRLAACAIRVARGRVVNRRGCGAQVPISERNGRYGGEVGVAEDIPAALVVSEEKELVLTDAAAETAPELIVNAMRSRAGEYVPGLQIVVAMIFKGTAMKTVGARFQGDVGHCSASPTQLRVVIRSADIDRCDCVSRRDDACQVLDVVIHPLDHVVIALVQAIDNGLQVLLGVEKRRVRPVGALHPRNHQEKVLVVPIV